MSRPGRPLLGRPSMRAIRDDRDTACARDLERLQDLIDRDGVRSHTRDFLQSVHDGCEQYRHEMTERQREAVDRIEERLDEKGWA